MHQSLPLPILTLILTLSTLTTASLNPHIHSRQNHPSPRATSPALDGKILIPNTCFNTLPDLEKYFSYLYPWGSDHNGAARMLGNSSYHEYIYLTNTSAPGATTPSIGTLNLKAVPVSQVKNAGPVPAEIHYFSGAVHATQEFTLLPGGQLTFQAEFLAPVVPGTWPGFWANAAKGWPPEVDMAEWKGDDNIWFNTYNTSQTDLMNGYWPYPNPNDWHTVKVVYVAEDNSNVATSFYLDDKFIVRQYGHNYVNNPLYLIINLQMEGSSGDTGPTGNTTFQIRNLAVHQS